MSEPLCVNLNSTVKVKLSRAGMDFYKGYNHRKLEDQPNKQRELKMPLWKIMHIFGSQTNWGTLSPFEGNNIILEEIIR